MKGKAKVILRFLKGNTHFFVLALIFSMGNTVLNAIIPQIIRTSVDSILGSEPLPQSLKVFADPGTMLTAAATAVIIIACLNMLCNYWARTFTAKGSEHFVKDFRDTLFAHIQTLPFEWHTKHQT